MSASNPKYLYSMKSIWDLSKYICIQSGISIFNEKYFYSNIQEPYFK